MTAVLLTLLNTLASLGLLGVLVGLGLPIYVIARRFGLTDRAPLGLCWLFGLTWLSVWSWYGLGAGVRPTAVYRALVIAAPVLVILSLAFLQPKSDQKVRSGTAFLADLSLDLLTFFASVLLYTGLIFSKLRPDDLPWATIFDGDIYVYLKSAFWLALFPVVSPGIGYADFGTFVRHDVFGCFNLLAFGRFALHTGIETLAVPTLGLAVGMISVAVARSCRLVFRLRVPLSLGLALTASTGPLFLYVVLNYFLSQMMFVSILLTVVLQAFESECRSARARVGSGLIMAAGGIATLLCYNVWALQYTLIVASLLAVVDAATGRVLQPRRVALTMIFYTAARGALALLAMALVSPDRLVESLDKLRTYSIPNIAGWALPFVDLNLLLGLPVEWQGMDSPRGAIAGPNLGFLLFVSVLLLAMVKLDRGPGLVARRLTLGCFCISLLAYMVVWQVFGEAYQQWKFASSLPLGFGFAVLASVIRLGHLDSRRSRRTLADAGAAIFLATCLILNIGIAREHWMASLVHLPAALAKVARSLDAEPGGEPVHVVLDDFNARHVALVMLNHRPTTFEGQTMFGFSKAPPANGRFIELTTPCEEPGTPNARYLAAPFTTHELPSLPPARQVSLSGNVGTCVALSGFGDAQVWGRSTEAATASIRFRCDCSPSERGYDLVLDAGVPEGVDGETVQFEVDDGPPLTMMLPGSGFRSIVVPLPSALRHDAAVSLSILLPKQDRGAVPATLLVAGLTVLERN